MDRFWGAMGRLRPQRVIHWSLPGTTGRYPNQLASIAARNRPLAAITSRPSGAHGYLIQGGYGRWAKRKCSKPNCKCSESICKCCKCSEPICKCSNPNGKCSESICKCSKPNYNCQNRSASAQNRYRAQNRTLRAHRSGLTVSRLARRGWRRAIMVFS